jgi:transcriptional regulator with XRE-family HTH domain
LATKLGVSPSLISQIELGRVLPSVDTLVALGQVLESSLDDLVTGEAASSPARRPGRNEVGMHFSPADDEVQATVVQRVGRRDIVELGPGVHWERLTPFSLVGMEFVHTVYEPGAATSPEGLYRRHSGREWGYILRGVFNVSVGFDEFVLNPGDSISFSSNVHHRLHNEGVEPVHAIWSVLGGAGDTAQQSPLMRAVTGDHG